MYTQADAREQADRAAALAWEANTQRTIEVMHKEASEAHSEAEARMVAAHASEVIALTESHTAAMAAAVQAAEVGVVGAERHLWAAKSEAAEREHAVQEQRLRELNLVQLDQLDAAEQRCVGAHLSIC